MNRETFLTARWNNRLSLAVGLPALGYAVAMLATSVITPAAEFAGLLAIGIVY
jgi:hypothetical protein